MPLLHCKQKVSTMHPRPPNPPRFTNPEPASPVGAPASDTSPPAPALSGGAPPSPLVATPPAPASPTPGAPAVSSGAPASPVATSPALGFGSGATRPPLPPTPAPATLAVEPDTPAAPAPCPRTLVRGASMHASAANPKRAAQCRMRYRVRPAGAGFKTPRVQVRVPLDGSHGRAPRRLPSPGYWRTRTDDASRYFRRNRSARIGRNQVCIRLASRA